MWIDSHAHLDGFMEADELPDVIHRAREQDVSDIVAIGGSCEANALALEAARAHAGVHAVLGFDRDEAERDPDTDALKSMLRDSVVVGVGETGLDYHYSPETAVHQCALLERMLDVACETGLPAVIHTRDAEEDTLSLLRAFVTGWNGPTDLPGVIHCYTGGIAFARSLMDLGMMLSFSGIITFKKADALREVVKIVPNDLLLIETDAPYLAPVPYRGRRNEPAYVRHVGEAVAAIRGCPVEEIAQLTTNNARRLFLDSARMKGEAEG